MSGEQPRRRVAITGTGAVSPAGSGVEALVAAAAAGVSCAAPIAAFDAQDLPVRFACEVPDFDPSGVLGSKEARRTDRNAQMALVATAEALGQAGELGTDPARVAVIAGTGVGGITTLESQIQVRLERGPSRVSPMLIPMMMANAAAGLISLTHGFNGPSLCVATACASGANAIGEAVELIRAGRADAAVAGGTESTITPTALAAFSRMGALSARNDDPAAASRPFDVDRDGFVMGEGAAFFVLEEWERAVSRGATILGEIAGYGRTCDAHHITAPSPDGSGAVACMQEALADAGVDPAAVSHVNAHGTSTPLNDRAEAEALTKVFGAAALPVTSTKGVTGHLVGAAGAVEAVVALETARTGLVPPTANFAAGDPEVAIDVVAGSPRQVGPGPALSNSFGFGGHNASLLLLPPANGNG